MCSRLLLGILQFVLNYNFVYAAELYITSGLAAVVFALLVVPNALLAWLFFGERVTGRFVARLGGRHGRRRPAVRPGNAAAPRRSTGDVLTGLGLTLLAVLAASISNVMQLMPAMQGAADRRRCSAGRCSTAPLIDAAVRLGVRRAAGGRAAARLLARPPLSRPDRLGARLLALFRDHPRGRPGQGGLFERADPDHRHGDLDRRSKAIAGRRSPSPAACSPSPAWSSRSAPAARRRCRRPTERATHAGTRAAFAR